MVMAMGAFLGLIGIPIPGIEIGIAVSDVVSLATAIVVSLRKPWMRIVVRGE